ncbi:MAG TPA: ubiquinol-cytochrome C chaperone family protein [Acetobacteraceae bacterium]
MLRLRSLRKPTQEERAGSALYRQAVAAARTPWFYRDLGVPDTLDGRFDLIALHTFLLIHRLQDAPAPGPALAQGVFDAMFSDMDNNLREIGVSDLSVGRRMRAMWEAFHGRSKVYAAAIDAADRPGLEASLTRNVWRGTAPDGAPAALASVVLAQSAHLRELPLAVFIAGSARFVPAEVAR